jgi:hypothetical protein
MSGEIKHRVEFTCFPLLPAEIRLKIWKLSIPDTARLLPSPPVPGLLVSHEARSVYIKAYSPCFRLRLGAGIMPPSLSGFLSNQANFDKDTLFFGDFYHDCSWHKYEIWSEQFSRYLVEGAVEKIQHLAVRYFCTWSEHTRDRLLELKGLKPLTIAVDHTDYNKWEEDEHWSVSQRINWDAPLQEIVIREGDGQWAYMSGIQKFLHGLEYYFPGYKAPELQFARIIYTYGGLKDCWKMTGSGYESVHDGYHEKLGGSPEVIQWRMARSEPYSKCPMPSGSSGYGNNIRDVGSAFIFSQV